MHFVIVYHDFNWADCAYTRILKNRIDELLCDQTERVTRSSIGISKELQTLTQGIQWIISSFCTISVYCGANHHLLSNLIIWLCVKTAVPGGLMSAACLSVLHGCLGPHAAHQEPARSCKRACLKQCHCFHSSSQLQWSTSLYALRLHCLQCFYCRMQIGIWFEW